MRGYNFIQKLIEGTITDERSIELLRNDVRYNHELMAQMESNNFFEDFKREIGSFFRPYTDEKIYVELERDKFIERFGNQLTTHTIKKTWKLKCGEVMIFLWKNELRILFWDTKEQSLKLPFIWFDNQERVLSIIQSIVRITSRMFLPYMMRKSERERKIRLGIPTYEMNDSGDMVLINPNYREIAKKIEKEQNE